MAVMWTFQGVTDSMSTLLASTSAAAPTAKVPQIAGHRKNGKQWHPTRKAFRPTAGQTSYAKRATKTAQQAEVKKLETEMKAEKEEERQRRIQAIKDKRAARGEKERFEKMAEKMHAKRVERLRRREKRNKLLKS
ncbi:rRNA-processing protein cgr1 [Friedmanniomyces endolithicus]|uniref:rRNA-processing protein n=1 Tax=Friedmanniomyces endolithicus TaxID=329885 RepID=A0AAN6FS94_9PEZI|nr:rRNA-processing protein cgr1 [Friedmanniomyces endolithicus]KAK0299048.1 rRNA-processing protein cgr1 [Friedmanniomyces endolithicus]KAK0322853.1 rRNA-processing protein cgr1 [Friedmanniomyces endolithicus]